MGEQNQPPNNNQQDLHTLLQRGINDARLKNKEEARAALRQVVQIDPQNEKGWFWLASVAETDDERLEALQNVVLINPDNQRAYQILEKLEQVRAQKAQKKAAAKAAEAPASKDLASLIGSANDEESEEKPAEEAAELTDLDALNDTGAKKAFSLDSFSLETFTIGNLDPQKSRLVLMAGAAAVLAVCFICILAMVGGGGSDDPATDETNTDNNQVAQATATPEPNNVVEDGPTATPFLSATPPPSPTPTETVTPTPEPVTYPAPPNEVTGNLLMSSGAYASGYQPVVLFNLYEDTAEDISGGDYGSYPSLNGDLSQFIYIEYSQGSRRADAKIVNRFDPNEEQFFDDNWDREIQIEGLDMPTWAPSNTMIAFVADPIAGGNGKNLFIFTFDGAAPAEAPAEGEESTEGDGGDVPAQGTSPFIEVQSPETYSEPAWSPDSARIVVVADSQGSIDLHAYEIGTGQVTQLTTDGNALRESSPDWSSDGRIIFSGESLTTEGSDIYIMPSDGSGAPNLFIDLGPHDINPRWSPDNRYIAFSSDINGAYNVYVYDLANDTFYTVTNETRLDSFLADWVR